MNPRFIRIPISPVRRAPAGMGPAAFGPETAPQPLPMLERPAELSLHDWAIFLLHTAAEVEHALLVQYLFAAYSIRPAAPVNTSTWRLQLIKIAKEEMGHLLCLQNLLRFVGGPPNLEREDFPIRSLFYPFPFTLEKFSKNSLAKYVFAEMPEGAIPEEILSPSERAEIEDRARQAAGVGTGAFLNHVGTLYRTLDAVFSDDNLTGFRPQRFHFQARSEEPWTHTNQSQEAAGTVPIGIKLFRITNRQDALDALSAIARQGEAANSNDELTKSHFGRFLQIYRMFPDNIDPAHPVATNPNTDQAHPTSGTITNPETLLWAQLFNIRYRMLLSFISHAVLTPATVEGQPEATVPANVDLVIWVYDEMLNASGSIRDLAIYLAKLPLGQSAAVTAGAPFELPHTLNLPDQDPDRWRLHWDLIAAAKDIIAAIKANFPDSENPFLDDILYTDGQRLPIIEARMAG